MKALADEIDHTIAACQEDNLMIQCRNRYNKITVKDVFYGRDNLFTCTSKTFNATKLCDQPTPSPIVQKVQMMCSGENKCKIPVTSEFLEKKSGEICPDIRKYLKVTYSCQQIPQMVMVCPDQCPNSCWPTCSMSCCEPPSDSTNKTEPVDQPPPMVTTILHQAAVLSPQPVQQCAAGCPTQCAPLCQPTCCQSQMPMMQDPSMMCPGDCASSCFPSCSSSCCSQQQSPPKALTNKQGKKLPAPKPMTCEGSCPDSCAPSCDLQCCAQQTHQIQTPVQCPGSCPQSCAPSCNPSCCMHQSSMMMPPPLPPMATCAAGCAPQCAPLCQPTCCQSAPAAPMGMMIPAPQTHSTCAAGCPNRCAPMCQPTCCGGQQPMGMMPPVQPMAMAAPPMVPYIPPPQPMMAPAMDPSMMMGGCSPMCTPPMCDQSCSPECCSPELPPTTPRPRRQKMNGVSPHEVEARRNYQEMLRSFRERQIQNYFTSRRGR